jgi:hypothetical protein
MRLGCSFLSNFILHRTKMVAADVDTEATYGVGLPPAPYPQDLSSHPSNGSACWVVAELMPSRPRVCELCLEFDQSPFELHIRPKIREVWAFSLKYPLFKGFIPQN